MKAARVILMPGEEILKHSTKKGTELLLVLKGTATVFFQNKFEYINRQTTCPKRTLNSSPTSTNEIIRMVMNIPSN